jgi:hypothetical protein
LSRLAVSLVLPDCAKLAQGSMASRRAPASVDGYHFVAAHGALARDHRESPNTLLAVGGIPRGLIPRVRPMKWTSAPLPCELIGRMQPQFGCPLHP